MPSPRGMNQHHQLPESENNTDYHMLLVLQSKTDWVTCMPAKEINPP